MLLLPASASAQSCVAPPGTAGIDQYCESLPGPGGDRGRTDAGGSQPRGSIPQSILRSEDGLRLLRLAQRTSERAGSGSAGDARRGPVGADLRGPVLNSSLLIWLLVLAGVAMVAFAVARYLKKQRETDGEPA